MTKIYDSFLSQIIEKIIDEKNIDQFVETGTYTGKSLSWISQRFQKVYTIEINEQYYTQTKENFKNTNINFLLGDSRDCLRSINLNNPSVFWLDAHSGGGVFSNDEDCPLVDELKIIIESKRDHFILIDDAYAFMFPLSHPYNYKKWPTLNDIFDIIGSNYTIFIKNDVIIAIPKLDQDTFQEVFSKNDFPK